MAAKLPHAASSACGPANPHLLQSLPLRRQEGLLTASSRRHLVAEEETRRWKAIHQPSPPGISLEVPQEVVRPWGHHRRDSRHRGAQGWPPTTTNCIHLHSRQRGSANTTMARQHGLRPTRCCCSMPGLQAKERRWWSGLLVPSSPLPGI